METIVIAGVIVAGTYLLARKSPVGRRLFDNKNQPKPKLKEKRPLGMSDKDYIKKVMAEDKRKFQHEAKIAEERARSDRHSL